MFLFFCFREPRTPVWYPRPAKTAFSSTPIRESRKKVSNFESSKRIALQETHPLHTHTPTHVRAREKRNQEKQQIRKKTHDKTKKEKILHEKKTIEISDINGRQQKQDHGRGATIDMKENGKKLLNIAAHFPLSLSVSFSSSSSSSISNCVLYRVFSAVLLVFLSCSLSLHWSSHHPNISVLFFILPSHSFFFLSQRRAST